MRYKAVGLSIFRELRLSWLTDTPAVYFFGFSIPLNFPLPHGS